MKYWKQFGYTVIAGGRAGKNNGARIKVLVSQLLPNSNIYIACLCNECNTKFLQRFSRNKEICNLCRKQKFMRGNTYGTIHKGKKIPSMCGMNHPRWNPNKSEFRAYASKVRIISEEVYKTNINAINPNDHRRTLCGTDGGYQLDHIISIKFGFDNGIDPSTIGNLNNLQMLPWKENRSKWI